ncbi:type II secretion system protein [Succinimonas sp.]|uniref:type II secretion system protein n=1 Tax=Succinimonas sp. TaxID=1936151 RepID=UPI0038657D0E
MRSIKSGGFTLIELVVVIVILGILAAVAVPKFMDLQRDARISKLNGLMAAIKSAGHITLSKSVIAGIEQYPADNSVQELDLHYLCLDGSASDRCDVSNGIAVSYGYPAVLNNPPTIEKETSGILRALDIDYRKHNAADRKDHDWQYKVKKVSEQDVHMLIGPSDIELPEYNVSGGVIDEASKKGCYVVYGNPHKDANGSIKRVIDISTDGC